MYQSIHLIGYLGKDPEMRYTPSGQAVTSFSVATSRKYTGSDGDLVSETAWFRVTTWGKQAETCNEYLHKGSRVFVEGRLNVDLKTGGPRIWEDREGAARTSFEVTASQVRFLSGKEETTAAGETAGTDEDQIPF